VFGLLFTVTVGGFIVGMSYALEPILTLLHRRRGYQQYAYLEWVSNQSLQLHRLAHEDGGEKGDPDRDNSASTGRREWLNCTKDVPVTGADVQLAPLDITDMEHPLLLIAITTEPPDTATAAGSEEDQLNLPDLELPPLGFPITTESTSTVMPDESNEDQADTSAAEDLAQSMPLPMTTKPSDIATPVESAEDNNTERRQVRSHFLE
jgi:hypothetical protein